jgi:hypothetical protein
MHPSPPLPHLPLFTLKAHITPQRWADSLTLPLVLCYIINLSLPFTMTCLFNWIIGARGRPHTWNPHSWASGPELQL